MSIRVPLLMPVLYRAIVYIGEATDGYIVGEPSANYAVTRNTSALCTMASNIVVGQIMLGGQYSVNRSYVGFDTSGLARVPIRARLFMKAKTDSSDTDFIGQLWRFAWQEPLCTYQEQNYDGAYGGASTLEGTFYNTADGFIPEAWYSMLVDPAGINITGKTKYALVSKKDVDNVAPTGNEYVRFYSANTAGSEPYLRITL